MTFEDALNKLDGLEVDFSLSRNRHSYGDTKRGWNCSISAGPYSKSVSAFSFGDTASAACIKAVEEFFDVQSNGLPLASIKTAVPGAASAHLIA